MDRRQAKQHWTNRTNEWKTWAQSLIADIQTLEDPAFRHCVAGTLDACASGCGNVIVRRLKADKLSLVGISLDPEVSEALERGVRSLNEDVDFPKLLGDADAPSTSPCGTRRWDRIGLWLVPRMTPSAFATSPQEQTPSPSHHRP